MLRAIRISIRHIRRNKISSLINIGGLAMGIAAFLLILEYVSFERGMNSFHTNLPHIFRLINEAPDGKTWPETEPGWATKVTAAFPEIKSYCRYEDQMGQGIVKPGNNQSESFRETKVGYADGNFFSFFSFPLQAGQADALRQSNTIFLSATIANKYFGKENPVGKSLTLFNQFGQTVYTVGGVYTIPVNSDIQVDLVCSLETLKNPANLHGNDWADEDNTSSQYINTCFLLKPGVDEVALEKKLTALRTQLKKDKDGLVLHLQPFANIHLSRFLNDNYPTTGNLKYIYILSLIALLILAIAWFNYINLSTANALKRSNEVGVRKVVGATRGSLIFQFLVESLLVNLAAVLIAVVIVSLVQPLFNSMIDRQLSLASIGFSKMWIAGVALILGGSLLAGFYTAFSLSNFNPVQTLKGKLGKTARGGVLRKSLVVTQFAISIALIITTAIIYQQLQYMQSRNLGLDAEQLLVVRGPEIGKDSSYRHRKSAFLQQLSNQPFVQGYSQSGTVPGNFYNFNTSGFTQPNSSKGDELKSYAFAIVDSRYLDTYKIGLKAGRNFTDAECSVEWNDNSKVLMNERAIAQLGFHSPEDALHTLVQWDERQLQVIGVVKDYHHTGLQRSIDPMIFYPQNSSSYFSVRLGAGDMRNHMKKVEALYKSYFAGNPFEYFFEDENFNKQYTTERQYGHIFTTAALWAIVIACLGLFGLTTFSVESRMKEIGIRKVLGASVTGIVGLLSKDFLKLVLLSVLLASPLAWWATNHWLQDFAYRINVQWWLFVIVGVFTALIALLTISFQAIRAAIANPVKSLHVD